jgi:hypothetical protein
MDNMAKLVYCRYRKRQKVRDGDPVRKAVMVLQAANCSKVPLVLKLETKNVCGLVDW